MNRHFVNFKEVDGFEVITGFTPPSIDPRESYKVVGPLLEMTEEHKKAISLNTQYGQLERQRVDVLKAARQNRDPSQKKVFNDRYEVVVGLQKVIQKEAAEFKPELTKKRQELLKENAVYFQVPGCREIDLKTLGGLSDKIQALKRGQFLTTDGDVINDNRGREYWYRDDFYTWIQVIIDGLDQPVPTNGILVSDLTADQRAEIAEQRSMERISKLTREEKKDERKVQIERVLMMAASKRSQLEIEGTKDPLKQSQFWYEQEKAKIENLYK